MSITGMVFTCISSDRHQLLSNICASNSESEGCSSAHSLPELRACLGIVCVTESIERQFEATRVAKSLRGILMRRTIEHLFEVVEANTGYAIFAVAASFAMTGCLHLLWE
jgi:hypothetical protein